MLSYDQKLYLAEEAGRAGCQGHRGEIFACEIARASAALNDRVSSSSSSSSSSSRRIGVVVVVVLDKLLCLPLSLRVVSRGFKKNQDSPQEFVCARSYRMRSCRPMFLLFPFFSSFLSLSLSLSLVASCAYAWLVGW